MRLAWNGIGRHRAKHRQSGHTSADPQRYRSDHQAGEHRVPLEAAKGEIGVVTEHRDNFAPSTSDIGSETMDGPGLLIRPTAGGSIARYCHPIPLQSSFKSTPEANSPI